ncbi:restriction system protein [Chryseobacterium sp. RU37D]|uniref:restriction endonuclease n=1 Tax=Chryseobacterium sp. RU37D TaxID=1907397 RepID=UPI0009565E9E|nr:restriction endonuclease [Chryseobacterium sp. RU37D]SIQ65073.1 restriction system protein [Chryseobacterium sp. RU37D]
MEQDFKIWMVRAGSGGYLIDEFLSAGIAAIGWNDLGEIPTDISYDSLKQLYERTYPEDSTGRINQNTSQVWRFAKDINIGDKVVTYDSTSRNYYLGEITSDYDFDTTLTFHHIRRVEWMPEPTGRDVLSTASKNTLGSVLTTFEIVSDVWEDLLESNPENATDEEIVLEEKQNIEEEPEKLVELKEDVQYKSQEFIKDIIANLSWQDTERLVAGIFRGIGYKTRMTPSSSDLGSDIIVSPDELGMEEPRIKVEVKKRTREKIGTPDIRSFIGGMRDYNKGIFVSTSGFSKDARHEAERANIAITLVDLDWLVELLLNNYENLDVETKALVPLKRIYWPV